MTILITLLITLLLVSPLLVKLPEIDFENYKNKLNKHNSELDKQVNDLKAKDDLN